MNCRLSESEETPISAVSRSKCTLRHRRPTGPPSAGSQAHQKGRSLDSNWSASGDNLGPSLFRSYDAATEQLDARLVVLWYNAPMELPEASIDLSVNGYADDLTRAAVAKNLTGLGQTVFELLWKATLFNSILRKGFSAACCGSKLHEGPRRGLPPEHISLQAKYFGLLRTIERCQAAEASFAICAPFFRSQTPQRFKVHCSSLRHLLVG